MNWKKQRSNLSDTDPSNIGTSLKRQSSRDILNIYNWVWSHDLMQTLSWRAECRTVVTTKSKAMVHSCCVVGCRKQRGGDQGISFFVIPAIILNQGEKTHELSRKRRDAWLSSINRKDWMPSSNSRVCSEHFISGRYYQLNTVAKYS